MMCLKVSGASIPACARDKPTTCLTTIIYPNRLVEGAFVSSLNTIQPLM